MTDFEISEALINFIENLEYQWDSGSIIIDNCLVTDQVVFHLTELARLECDSEIIKNRKLVASVKDIAVGDSLQITISPPRRQSCFFAKNIDQILERHDSLIITPDNFVVVEENYISWKNKGVQPLSVTTYFALNNLILVLLKNRVFEEFYDETLTLSFENDSIQLIPRINCAGLLHQSEQIQNGSAQILSILESEEHLQEKVRILKSAIHSFVKSVEKEHRFSHLLSQLDEIAKHFSNNFDLYISEFSFESKFEELLKEQSDFSKKLGETLSSIQANILAVPLSLILAFTQMKSEINDNPLTVNTAVTVSALVFSILLLLLLRSRKATVSLLKTELDKKNERLLIEIPHLYEQLKGSFDLIYDQFFQTYFMIKFIAWITGIGIISTLIFYIIKTPQISSFVVGYFHNIFSLDIFPHIMFFRRFNFLQRL